MHCPSCGQQQVTNNTKFCSRCGMPLVIVSELLIHGGYLPQLAELNKSSHTIYTRKNGIMFGIFWFIFFVPLLASIFGGVFNIEVLGEILALIGCFGALMIFIFSLVYLKKAPKQVNPNFYEHTGQNPAGLYPMANAALPPQQSIPVSGYTTPPAGNWRDTNDLQPSNMSDNATKLLSKDEEGQ
jgi:hypothetical protein